MKRIYLDHAATTPLLPEVREAMLPWLTIEYGNASSLHEEGRRAKAAIDAAREQVSAAVGCLFAEVLFTSGGTEASNLALLGAAFQNLGGPRKKILLGAAEHHCVLHTRPILEKLGYEVALVPVDRVACLDLDALNSMLNEEVLLISAMLANNELGTRQPMQEVARLAQKAGALFHCDAVQSFLVDPLPDADLISFSAHKLGGPKGAGAIYIRAGVKIAPLAVGGGQEREMRAGTENVAAIVGFGETVRLRASSSPTEQQAARDHFAQRLVEGGLIPSTRFDDTVLPGHAHFRAPGISAETFLILLDRMGVSASSGAACSSGSLEPSHVLLACGYSLEEAKEGLRFTFGRKSTMVEAKEAASRVLEAVYSLRTMAKER